MSLAGSVESLLTIVTFRSILRECGSARFSGTGNFVQNAGTPLLLCGGFNSHAVKVNWPLVSVAGGAGFTRFATGVAEAASASALVAAARGASVAVGARCLPHHCQPNTPANITTATMRMIMREFIFGAFIFIGVPHPVRTSIRCVA